MSDDRSGSSLPPSIWLRVGQSLGIEVVAPFVLNLPSGAAVNATAVVRHFGARLGMLVVDDFDKVRQIEGELDDAGYGYSVMDEPKVDAPGVVEGYIEVLRDWGWAGPEQDEPKWLRQDGGAT